MSDDGRRKRLEKLILNGYPTASIVTLTGYPPSLIEQVRRALRDAPAPYDPGRPEF